MAAMNPIMRFSYVILSGLCLGIVGAFSYRAADRSPWLLSLLALLAVFLSAWILARRGRTPPHPEKRLKKSLGGGRPVLVHFYSDYALTSLLSRPAWAVQERRYQGRVEFLFMSMLDPQVCLLARGLRAGLGDTRVYDARGQEVGRTRPTARELERLLERPSRPG